ncbi:4-hydroxy-tetrahydrodipicolinate reductase [Alicyclobacillus tolerans]|uniref:4-hydroxy-tetrahydrodipicolinate reductase n=1 Tax=Alicyclobacillus tolerans TaxID=90970 RepID=UPI001F016008|nr:4-hydroxy-tetrahydrodipicolinate reductase [Alicyclobacillus tolerans]MCF8563781.1 4-hydroxy-tetrahydrodipicolinate reductase [Alicyclobacillus tolerans]
METPRIKVAVAGAAGKMGREAVAALREDPRFELAAVLMRSARQAYTESVPVYTDPEQLLEKSLPDVWLDLTDASSVVRHVDMAMAYGVRPVIGATGYTPEDLKRWEATCQVGGLGAIAAPNFAIGALLMVRFASEAARFFQQAEIIELHHDQKKDAPSGTAKRTAEAIALNQSEAAANDGAFSRSSHGQASTRNGSASQQSEAHNPARGLSVSNIPIHSVRLPGLVAHQEVLFGGTGEVLTIRHDSLSRTSFMPGITFACAKVMELNSLVYGLEHLLW